MTTFSHLDEHGEARMVDVGSKPVQKRTSTATATLICQPETILALRNAALPKGDVLAVARVAGIQAAKKTSDLIPLCHQLGLAKVSVEFRIEDAAIHISCTAATSAQTGVEMEALTGAAIAGLTLYDMMKAVDKSMQITDLVVTEKSKL